MNSITYSTVLFYWQPHTIISLYRWLPKCAEHKIFIFTISFQLSTIFSRVLRKYFFYFLDWALCIFIKIYLHTTIQNALILIHFTNWPFPVKNCNISIIHVIILQISQQLTHPERKILTKRNCHKCINIFFVQMKQLNYSLPALM